MKICFLGAAAVGKTTFVSALLSMAESYPRFYAPFTYPDGSNNDAVKDIMRDAEVLAAGGTVPSTTIVRKVFGRLLLTQDTGVDIEFIDLPGSLFTRGYIDKDAEAIDQIRQFALDSDYLYFFFEPDDFSGDCSERVRTFLEVLQDYYESAAPDKTPHITIVLTKADLCPELYLSENGRTNPDTLREYMVQRSDGLMTKLEETADGRGNVSYAAISTRNESSNLFLSSEDFQGLFSKIFANLEAGRIKRGIKRYLAALCVVAIAVLSGMWLYTSPDSPIDNTASLEVKYNRYAKVISEHKQDVLNKDNYARIKKELIEDMADAPTIDGKTNLLSSATELWQKLVHDYKQRLLSDIKSRRDSLLVSWSEISYREYGRIRKEYEDAFGQLPPEYSLSNTLKDYHTIREIAGMSNFDICDKARNRVSAIEDYMRWQRLISDDTEIGEIREALGLAKYLCGGSYPLTLEITANCAKIHKDETYWSIVDNNINFDKAQEEDDVVEEVPSDKLPKASEDGVVSQRVLFHWSIGKDISIRFWERGNKRSGWDEHLRGVIKLAHRNCALMDLCGARGLQAGEGDWNAAGLSFSTRVFKGDATQRASSASEITQEDIQNMCKYILEDEYWNQKAQENTPQ